MRPVPTRFFLLLLLSSSLVAAANFTQCLEDFKNEPNAIGGVDSRGRPTSSVQAVGLTYETCTARCGTDAGSFGWKEFGQLFSSWLLPWLALISQLPFGSGNYGDDFASVIMSVGSPALAAYSLFLTSLNARSVYRRAHRIKHENKNALATALISLQQTPLELTRDERLLAFIPLNDQWRREIVERLRRRNAWSVATASSVAWVVIAFLFTLVDSFVTLHESAYGASEGHGVGTLWLWLLCLVIGWLWVPTFSCGELKSAIGHANRKAAKKAAKRVKQKATKAYSSAKTRITNRLPRRVPTPKVPKIVAPTPDIGEEGEEMKLKQTQEVTEPFGQETEGKLYPFPDSTRHPSTVSFQLPTESQHDHDRTSLSVNPAADRSAISLPDSAAVHSIAAQSSIHPETDRLLIPRDDFGPLHRDEFRLAATFNYSRIMRYLVLVDEVLEALDKLSRKKDGKRHKSEATTEPAGVVFPHGALISMFNASIFALILQCGTTAAATIIIVFTPTVGLGCRSLGYILYGATAVLIMFLTIISTILVRISETRVGRSNAFSVKGFTAFTAIALRRFCLVLALINATGLIALSCFQFSHLLDNCYCNAAAIGRGTDSYVVISFEGWISTMRTSRISATILAGASMAIYMFSLWLLNAPPTENDYF